MSSSIYSMPASVCPSTSSAGGVYAPPSHGHASSEYNYCFAPHVRAETYKLPPQIQAQPVSPPKRPTKNDRGRHNHHRPAPALSGDLVFVNVVQRHHKRSPDNLYPAENTENPSSGWDCSDMELFNYATGLVPGMPRVAHQPHTPSWHPFLQRFWNGTCDAGQLTLGGLRDSVAHGRDFWAVYGPQGPMRFLDEVDKEHVYFRTSPEERTFQVAGGLLKGMDVGSQEAFHVHNWPSTLDDIVPSYSCAYADSLRTQINQLPKWTDHLSSKKDLFEKLNAAVGTTDQSGWNSWIDHHFDALASRQCHDHPLPSNITQDLANQVYAEGDWEYDFIWNSAGQLADDYVRYSFGVFTAELARNLRAVRDGVAKHKLKYYVGHDGTMVRLLRTLSQSGTIRWPAMGSEVILEVWKLHSNDERRGQHGNKSKLYVRILSYGAPLCTDDETLGGDDGVADWIPLSDLITYLEKRVPEDLVARCNGDP